jgi:hypothetical protein
VVRSRIKLSHNRIQEFDITEEFRQQGISKVCVIGKTLLVYNSRNKPIHCQYDKNDLSKTMHKLGKALSDSNEFDRETIEKILVLLSRAWLASVESIPPKVHKLLSNLGAKLYFFRMPYITKREEELVEKINEDFGLI